MSGTIYIWYNYNGVEYYIDLGTLTAMTDTVSKRAMTTPIVSRPMRDTFPVENANSQSYSIRFTRKHPGTTEYNDIDFEEHGITLEQSQKLSNKRWYELMTHMMNRWQARTNGCKLIYIPDNGGYYHPRMEVGGFVKSLNRRYSVEFNEIYTGTLTFTVGTMHMNQAPPSGGMPFDDMDILISDSERLNWYLLHAGGLHSCITSATITGGSETPFESVELKISRKKLQEFVPEFKFKRGIRLAKNLIRMDFMGKHTLTVVQVKTGDTITLKAYCQAYTYTSAKLATSLDGDAFFLIEYILSDSAYDVTFSGSSFRYYYKKGYDNSRIFLPEGTNVWRALQICAMVMGCKIYFCDDTAYLIDYRATGDDEMVTNIDFTNIRFDYDTRYTLFDKTDTTIGNRCTGETEIDDEGVDPLANTVKIVCSGIQGDYASNREVPYSDPDSVSTYETVEAGTINLPELADEESEESTVHQATTFAENYMSYLREPQRSITFRFRETYHQQGDKCATWASFFGDVARAGEFYDNSTSELITNYSDMVEKTDVRMPQKLVLSNFVRKYPQGICEYTFGTIANIDLSSSTSQINRAIDRH